MLEIVVGEKMYKGEGSRADTREVGGIVYWWGVHTNTHADKEQAGRHEWIKCCASRD